MRWQGVKQVNDKRQTPSSERSLKAAADGTSGWQHNTTINEINKIMYK